MKLIESARLIFKMQVSLDSGIVTRSASPTPEQRSDTSSHSSSQGIYRCLQPWHNIFSSNIITHITTNITTNIITNISAAVHGYAQRRRDRRRGWKWRRGDWQRERAFSRGNYFNRRLFLTPTCHFSRCLIHPWGSSCPQEGVALNQVGRIGFSLNILLIFYHFFTDQYDTNVWLSYQSSVWSIALKKWPCFPVPTRPRKS